MKDKYYPGALVHFDTPYRCQNGIVKRIAEDGAFVVYNCDNDWDNYQNYTAALTKFEDLQIGWI